MPLSCLVDRSSNSKTPPFPSRLRHRLALTLNGRGDGEGGRENPPVEPELSTVSKAPVD
jgi:hypothetical protein